MDQLQISERDKPANISVNESQVTVGLKVDQSVLDSSRQGYLLIYPTSNFGYEIRSGQGGSLKLRCIGVRTSVCVLNLHEEIAALNSIKGYQIEMLINCQVGCTGELKVAVSDHVNTDMLGSINMILEDIDELRIEVAANYATAGNKLRFHTAGYSKNHTLETMSLAAFAFKNKDSWPSAASNDFSLKHIHGNELSRVIYSQDKNYCPSNSNCKYRFTLTTKDMWRIVFYAQQTGKIESISPYESYVDQVDLV